MVADGAAVTVAHPAPQFFAFERAAYRIVKVRTNGSRLFVWTNCGQQLKETYAFELDSGFKVTPVLPRVAT